MTTSRVIRGTRAKIFLYLCAILVIVGIIACYNNTLSQLEDVKKGNDICHQQEENLSTQLQVISEYKQRLEKSLKTEKAEHQKTKNSLENQLKDEKNKNDKDSADSKMKLSSLQQHFNLLQTEYDDFKEESSKNQKAQQEIVNNLEAKLNELKEEMKKVKASKEGLKSQFIELQIEKERIEKEAQDNLGNQNEKESDIKHLTKENRELTREIESLKARCSSQDTLPEPKAAVEISSSRNFNKMSPVSSEVYQINKNLPESNNLNPDKVDQNQNVLAAPSGDNLKAPSSSSSTKMGSKPSQANLNAAKPLQGPVTPETDPRDVVFKVPDGVVPMPETKEKDQPVENARYQSARESVKEVAAKPVKEDAENAAHEVFDSPLGQNNGYDALVFGDNDHMRNVNIPLPIEKKHIDTLGNDQADYKDLQNDAQLEENEEDDDADGYDDRGARQKEPAVRN
ncbi:unnamed protein product [Phaedon cochleariae]|uniref:Golgi integral membrane protein 4 n=1 Tax=Phaedon cochleariae TaxID=80249 RepID=A0A9P0D9D5_PHACE|nr:unnamed protein product [Phaedon cochleariae]